jgi:dTDP-4-amino-4,6-dideoxygalactose transaminase
MQPKTKKEISDLAIFGGSPHFINTLHVGKPNIGDQEKLFHRLNDILDNRWLTNNGPLVKEFLGVKHCIAICNATIALEITARALGLRGEVITPSFTFIATAHSLQWQEITPVFCDIDPRTHNIDPKQIEQLITPRTTGILGVHVWGRACEVDDLQAIAKQHKIKLFFDAAHALGCSYKNEMIGGFGDAEVFSFHATKFFNTLEGGAITTNNDELAEKIRLMRNFGFTGLDDVIYIGTNGKMNEFSAAMGLTSLDSLDEFIETNRGHYHCYLGDLSNIPGIKIIEYDPKELSNYQYIVVEIDEEACGISRDFLVKILHAENIRARRYFYPGCHQMEPYRSYFPNAGMLLPETEKLVERVLTLPTGTGVETSDIRDICQIIRFILNNSSEISRNLHNQQRNLVS